MSGERVRHKAHGTEGRVVRSDGRISLVKWDDQSPALLILSVDIESVETRKVTRFEQLAEAFPLHVQRIVECAYQDAVRYGQGFGRLMLDWLRDEADETEDAAYILTSAFDWNRSSEGIDYWAALYAGAP